jgi:hypothetical protein
MRADNPKMKELAKLLSEGGPEDFARIAELLGQSPKFTPQKPAEDEPSSEGHILGFGARHQDSETK